MRVSDLVPDELWEAVGPLLPPERPKPNGGWLLAYRRLAVRYGRQVATVLGLLHLACTLVGVRFLRRADLAPMSSRSHWLRASPRSRTAHVL